jgi:hypothetical protein
MSYHHTTESGKRSQTAMHAAAHQQPTWWGGRGFGIRTTKVSSCEWLGAVDLLAKTPFESDAQEEKNAAHALCEELEQALEGSTDKVFLATLKQLYMAGEITIMGFIIRLTNLYPEEMEALDASLKQRIEALNGV